MDLRTNRNFSFYNIFVTEVESVYCAVRSESLYNTDTFRLYRVNDALMTSSDVFKTDLVS
jgi:hypothetical protein